MVFIYLVTNISNNPNKVYIGKSINKSWRKYSHNKKWGNNIIYSIIDEVNDYIWKDMETYWIEQFRCWGFEIINKNTGGGGPKYHTEETKQKMKGPKPNSGKGPRINREGFSHPRPWLRKSIIQLDKNGNFVKEWSCAYEASKQLNINYLAINNVLKRRAKTSGGFIWLYK